VTAREEVKAALLASGIGRTGRVTVRLMESGRFAVVCCCGDAQDIRVARTAKEAARKADQFFAAQRTRLGIGVGVGIIEWTNGAKPPVEGGAK
jgi:hypothetical protein